MLCYVMLCYVNRRADVDPQKILSVPIRHCFAEILLRSPRWEVTFAGFLLKDLF